MSDICIWSGTIIGKTDERQEVYLTDITVTQVWWDIDPFYAACHIKVEKFEQLKNIVAKRINLMFDTATERYCLPITISEMELSEMEIGYE